ncbi:T9SS type A sorting domain-containing protein [candidate division KSB1 bacterium]|nr:T9SS type A sorting domain-containing protein [candidate division KSB1 bacterium]
MFNRLFFAKAFHAKLWRSFGIMMFLLCLMIIIAHVDELSAQTWFVAGDRPQDYDMGGDPTVPHGAANAGYIKSKVSSINGFGTWMTRISANDYRGQGLRLSAYVQTIDVKDNASLWMRVETSGRTTTFDNMNGRAIKGDTDWSEYEIVLDIEENSTDIFFGIMLSGTGEMVVDGLQLQPAARTWEPQNSRTTNLLFCVDAVDENVVWAGGWSGRYTKTTDGGQTWNSSVIPNAQSVHIGSIVAFDDSTAYVAAVATTTYDTRIYKTIDGGTTWTLQYQNTRSGAFFNSIAFWDRDHGIAVSDPVDGGFLIVTTTNGGAEWTQVPAENIPAPVAGEFAGFGDTGGRALAVYGSNQAWFGTASVTPNGLPMRILRSTDGGQHWTASILPESSAGANRGVSTLTFKDSLTGYAGVLDGTPEDGISNSLIKTTDGGESWQTVTSFPPYTPMTVTFIPHTESQYLFATAMQGSAYSLDGGDTWQPVSSTQVYLGTSFVSPTAGWAVGSTGRIGKLMADLFPTEIKRDQHEIRLEGFELAQNYPNPFNPTTTIQYNLPQPGRVKLTIHNLMGRHICTPVDEEQHAGQHHAVWNTLDESGNPVCSGVYFYTIIFSCTNDAEKEYWIEKKMLLIK